MDTLALIEELINKECERYELDKNGFITDRGELVRMLSQSKYAPVNKDCTQEEFEEWKKNILVHLYTLKDFSGYLRKKQKSRPLYQLTRRLTKNIISRLRKENVEITLDQELRLSHQRTLAFKLSAALFAEMYHEMFSLRSMYITPAQIEFQCECTAKELYPIDCYSLINRLKQNDNEFWDEMMKVIKSMSCRVIHKYGNNCSKALAEDIFSELLLSFKEQLNTGKIDKIESATHLIHSLRLTCQNKLFEYFRLHAKQREGLLENPDWSLIEELSEFSYTEMGKETESLLLYLLDIDENDEYELSCAIVTVLCSDTGYFYESLVSGEKDKVDVLMMHTYHQMEYEEIAKKMYGTSDPQKCSRLRQMVSRVKKPLRKRMKDIIVQVKNHSFNNNTQV